MNEFNSFQPHHFIDLSLIGKTDKELLARRFLPLIEKFFEDSEVQANFKKWQKAKQQLTFEV